MLGISWGTHTISVSIPAAPTWVADALRIAMANWEAAQLWFAQTYFPTQTGAIFSFTTIPNSSQPQLTIEYVPDEGQFWTGNTEVPISGPIVNETILLVQNRLTAPGDVIQVAQHELGHVLGLDHTTYMQDLMYPAMDALSGGPPVQPSTVNLYGVFMLAEGCVFAPEQRAAMPSWIPYLEWSPGMKETPANTPQGGASNPCPSQRPVWEQTWFIGPVALALAVLIAATLNARRKKTARPSRSVEY